MGTVTKLANVRACMALAMARELARRVRFRKVDGYETGDLEGRPDALEALCRYLGAGTRGCSRSSVWLAPKYRARLRTLKAGGSSDV